MSPETIQAIGQLSPAVVAIIVLGYVLYRQIQLFEKIDNRADERHKEQIEALNGLKEATSENTHVTSRLVEAFRDSDCDKKLTLSKKRI